MKLAANALAFLLQLRRALLTSLVLCSLLLLQALAKFLQLHLLPRLRVLLLLKLLTKRLKTLALSLELRTTPRLALQVTRARRKLVLKLAANALAFLLQLRRALFLGSFFLF